MQDSLEELNERVRQATEWVTKLREVVGQVVIGQNALIDRLLVGLLANGHVLLEGVPGLAKTLSVRTLAAAIHASFHRIQFTPDLLPADITGTLIYNPNDGQYHATKGPIFANIVLADEINRAPAKVQSALLEAMQERQVTLGGEANPLPSPFLVLATENPIDQEGTYPLPEAQVDRFMLKVIIGYPSFEEERRILANTMALYEAEDGRRAGDRSRGNPARAGRRRFDPRRRKSARLHRAHRLRDPRPSEIRAGPCEAHPVRRQPARDDQSHAGGKSMGALAGPQLCHARRRQGPSASMSSAICIILSYEAEAEGKTSDAIVKTVFDNVPVP